MQKVVLLVVLSFLLFGCGTQAGESWPPVYYRDEVIVLMYHHLSEAAESPEKSAIISPERFASHLDMLEGQGFNVISIEELGAFLDGKKGVPPNAVVITFDDGYESFYTYAYPELVKRNYPAAVFVIVSQVGSKDRGIKKLDWGQMREMQKHGMSFYSHTYNSHYYTEQDASGRKVPALVGRRYSFQTGERESPQYYRARVKADLRMAKELLEKNLGNKAEYLSYPYGGYSAEVITLARSVGYSYMFTITPGVNTAFTDHGKIKRINAGNPGISAQELQETILKNARRNPLAKLHL